MTMQLTAAPSASRGTAPREVLLRHATGVAVITAGRGAPVGLCATSLATVSLEPPVVSFAIGVRSSSWGTISTADLVLAHLLGEGQEDVARRFGRRGAAKFSAATRWRRDEHGLPRLDDVAAWLLLAPVARFPVDQHVLVVSRVVDAGTAGGPAGVSGPGTRPAGDLQAPLIHHAGRFGSFGSS